MCAEPARWTSLSCRRRRTQSCCSDGVFLHYPELRGHWDFSILLEAPFEVTIPRCGRRDGTPTDVNAIENRRYVEGQELYFRLCHPRSAASVVVDNSNLTSPEIVG